MELMDNPVCVITYRHPARIALRLGNHLYKGGAAKLDPDAWLAVWEFMMTSALKTCRGKVRMRLWVGSEWGRGGSEREV